MRRQVASLVFLRLCAASSLSAQSVQLNIRQDIETNATRLGSLALADFNGDGKPDIAVADGFSQVISVYLNDGTGNFGTPVTSSFSNPGVVGFEPIVAGDINEDGKQDLIVVPSTQNQLDIVLLGNGDGTFTEKGQVAIGGSFTEASLVDINGDKHLDVISGRNGGLGIALGDGAGNFTAQPSPNPGPSAASRGLLSQFDRGRLQRRQQT
jgi:hypothetical protein